jgi:photosystem II stability/assembly factor-like uncharacterized protein
MRHSRGTTKRACVLVFTCAVCIGCSYKIAQQMSRSQAQSGDQVKVVESVVRGEAPSSNRWDVTTIREGSLRKIQMLSNAHGWTASLAGSLYKTTDGGDTWQRSDNFKIPEGAYITDFSFSDAFGGVAISKNDTHFDEVTGVGDDEDASWIMNTSDGGQHWNPVFTKDNVQISRIAIVNTNEWWAVGRKFKSTPLGKDRGFIISSTDHGKTWTDISERLPIKTAGIDTIHPVRSLEVILTTSEGKLLSTRDGGMSWNQIGTLPEMREQVSIFRVGITEDNLLWVLGGTGGIEGTHSVIATKKADGFWTKYVLDGISLRDAVFLSDNQVVACGSMLADEESSERTGVVLSSNDGARSWTVTYRNPQLAGINSLSANDLTHIWAGGESGFILRRELPSKGREQSVKNFTAKDLSR